MKTKPAITINFDSTKDPEVVLIAHTTEHGKLDLVRISLRDLLTFAEKQVADSEKLQKSIAERTKARKRVVFQHKESP